MITITLLNILQIKSEMPYIRPSADEMLNGKLEFYHLLEEGKAATRAGKKRPLQDVMQDIRQEITDATL